MALTPVPEIRLPLLRRAVSLVVALATWAGAGLEAHAQSTIRTPGDHPDYGVEIEPHVLFGAFDPPGNPVGSGPGLGVRATIPIVANGFVPSINNSVGISFGLDWIHYQGDATTIGPCAQRIPGPGNTTICTAVGGPLGGPSDYFYVPAAMQWNFWLHKKFSVFGEPGLALYYEKSKYESSGHLGATPILFAGGRFHFSQVAALSIRVGYPSLSVGVSIFL